MRTAPLPPIFTSRGRCFPVNRDRGFRTRPSSLGHTRSLLGRRRPGHVTTYGEAAFEASREESTPGSGREKLRRSRLHLQRGLGTPFLILLNKLSRNRSTSPQSDHKLPNKLVGSGGIKKAGGHLLKRRNSDGPGSSSSATQTRQAGRLHNEQVVDPGSADVATSPGDKAIGRSWCW